MKSIVFNIQRFSLHDGNGIRTVIFYKGCPLRCAWCSNPESQSFEPSLMFDHRICKSFFDCLLPVPDAIKAGPDGIEIDRPAIQNPEKFRHICASKALTVSGEEKSTEELLMEIGKDVPFYRNDGGVTLSGGEPLSRGDELIELLQELKKRKIDVAVETSLHVQWTQIERSIPLVNTFLVDVKHTDPEKFQAYTSGDVHLVIYNLKRLYETGAKIIIRVPVIPGFNHTFPEMKNIIDTVATIKKAGEIHFLPYHTLGIEKYRMLSMEYPMGDLPSVQDPELKEYIEYAQSVGNTARIGS
jgi:pyruvate formate lyase activating enzyme